MAKLWFDTEFIDNGRTIELLSIGVIREDGESYYAEPSETDRERTGPWVRDNVLPHLTGPTRPRRDIAQQLVDFAGPQPEWWAYFAAYDWVALCQLYGPMMSLPGGWPAYCRDVQQLADQLLLDLEAEMPPPPDAHNALRDAEWTRDAWKLCTTKQADVRGED
ncbi:polyadenylate-specific 3'-exoribonuclease AS [Kribbella yunnanensis]|uniref:Polyadenylate-specific 3'-exoribonuclease AS n=1 Tax=Kribbella yunnanensis TaxID=190194 RepID=A0ABN2HDY2_9ACTN